MGVSVRSTDVARIPSEGEVIIVTQTSNTELLSATVCIGKMVNEAAIRRLNSVNVYKQVLNTYHHYPEV